MRQEGIPDYADDDSTAYDDVATGREADGPSPAALPADRDDGPVALDDVATTAEGQRHGESLDERLAEEEPDVSADELPAPESPLLDEATGEDQAAQVGSDAAVLDDSVVSPEPDSPVSLYDSPEQGQVGRLVQPDQGAHPDTETDEVAQDAGAAGGGASAEELAMHEVPEE